MKVRLADMRRELHVLRTGVANVDVVKREVGSVWVKRVPDAVTACTAKARSLHHCRCSSARLTLQVPHACPAAVVHMVDKPCIPLELV